MHADDRVLVLVCEGRCNPDLAEVDQLVIMAEGGRSEAREYSIQRTRALVHTTHEPIDAGTIWDVRIGWCRRYKCAKCGHVRRF